MAIGVPTSLGSTFTGLSYDTTALSLAASAIPNNSLVVALTGANNNQDGSTTNPVTSVVEGSNTYLNAIAAHNGTSLFYQIWYFYYTVGVSSPTITTSWALNNRLKVLQAVAISGIAPSGALDKTNSSTGTSTSASTASGALSQALEIIIAGAFIDVGAGYAAGTGFTNAYNGLNGSGQSFNLDYDIVASTSTVNHTPSWVASSPYTDILATFKGFVPIYFQQQFKPPNFERKNITT